jgi:transcriptional regulator with XRE-family HTH domain
MVQAREIQAKAKLAGISQKKIAEHLQIPYSTLSSYLGGFAPWPEGMERKIERYLIEVYSHSKKGVVSCQLK